MLINANIISNDRCVYVVVLKHLKGKCYLDEKLDLLIKVLEETLIRGVLLSYEDCARRYRSKV
jgi:hypothetical protein